MDLFTIFLGAYKSIKAIGSLRNSSDPILSFIDCVTNCSDFTITLLKPKKEEMQNNLVYFYVNKDGKLAYLTKDMDYNRPVIVSREEFLKFKDFKGNKIYDRIIDHAKGEKEELSILTKGAIYRFLLSKGKFTAGIKFFFHQKIKLPYRRFEKKIIAKFPYLNKLYVITRNFFTKVCTFCASETGIRILAIATSIGLAVSTGGTFFIAATAVYTASVAFSIVRQTIFKKDLNALKEEAGLLEEYCTLYKQKLELSTKKNIVFKDNFLKEQKYEPPKPESTVSKFLKASYVYFSTYIFEVGAPVAIAFLSPANAFIELSIITCSAAITSTVGVLVRKSENDKKALLRDAIDNAQEQPFIPPYKNLKELKEYVKMQKNQVQALKLMQDNLPPKDALKVFNHINKFQDTEIHQVSELRKFAQAMFEVVNPYDRTKIIKDEREVKASVQELKEQVDIINKQHLQYIEEANRAQVNAICNENLKVSVEKLKADGVSVRKPFLKNIIKGGVYAGRV